MLPGDVVGQIDVYLGIGLVGVPFFDQVVELREQTAEAGGRVAEVRALGVGK